MRIRRIGVDTSTNYTLASTSAYDADDPAGTTATWDDPEDMDQALTATADAATYQGALITFVRFPDVFEGVRVKVKPTYDVDLDELPVLEFWTHDNSDDAWTKRRAIELFDPFRGVPTTKARVYNLVLANQLRDVDAVWIVMNPGASGTPSMQWLAIQCLGHCDETPITPGSCEDETTVDCMTPSACELNPFDPSCIVPTLTCADFGLDTDEDGNCIIPSPTGPSFPNDPTGNAPVPSFQPPNFPTIDLCDPTAVEAFKQLLTPEQLSYFEDLLESVELPCLDPDTGSPYENAPINGNPDNPTVPIIPSQPIEVYVDPNTLERTADPRNEEAGDADDEPNVFDVPASAPIEYVGFFFSGGTPTLDGTPAPDGTAEDFFDGRFAADITYGEELIAAYARVLNPQDDNYGNITTELSSNNKTKVRFNFSGAVAGTVVNVRVIVFGIGGSITGSPNPHIMHATVDIDGDGLGTNMFTAVNTDGGVFADQNPVGGESYFRFNRPTPLGAYVNQLVFDCINKNYVGTGTGLNWGNGFMVRIVATPPGSGSAVTLTQEYVD